MYDVPQKKSKNLDPKFGVSINKKTKPTSKPKPAPSPTSYKQLNIDMATKAYVSKENQFTAKDPNTYSGTFKGKRYTWQGGKFLK